MIDNEPMNKSEPADNDRRDREEEIRKFVDQNMEEYKDLYEKLERE